MVSYLGGPELLTDQTSEIQAVIALAHHFGSISPGEAYALVLSWRGHLQKAGLAPGSVNRRLTALKSLTKRLSLAGLMSYQLTIERYREELYRDTSGPGAPGVRAMLETTSHGTERDIRDRAILRLLADLALRRSELTGLDVADVDLGRKLIWILRKGKLQKTKMDLSAKAAKDLAAWLDIRAFLLSADQLGGHPLFVPIDQHGNLRAMRLTGTGVYLCVRSRGLKAGVKARPHGLRHTSAVTALSLTNGNLEAVRELLGHEGYQAAKHYLREVNGLQRQVSEQISNAW
jgi:integrase/recombinase XerC